MRCAASEGRASTAPVEEHVGYDAYLSRRTKEGDEDGEMTCCPMREEQERQCAGRRTSSVSVREGWGRRCQ